MEISVVISTYNAIDWLKKTLAGYEVQTFKDFEIVIADDGSKEEVLQEINVLIKKSHLHIQHVWHEDLGFRKTIILNKALQQCKAPYIIMTDGDCVPREDFVEVHYNKRREGHFLSGGYFKLPMEISQKISVDDIPRQECFKLSWLKENGLNTSAIKNWKISATGAKAGILNRLTPTKPTWNGHNSSGWKTDIFNVNGFDERMEYGAEDREMGVRLINAGIKPIQIRYSAICIHLDHARGYVNREALDKNAKIFKQSIQEKKTSTPFGIVKS